MNCIVGIFFSFLFCVFELATIDFIRIWRRGLSASAFLQNHQKEKTQTVIGLKNYDKSRNHLTAYNFWG